MILNFMFWLLQKESGLHSCINMEDSQKINQDLEKSMAVKHQALRTTEFFIQHNKGFGKKNIAAIIHGRQRTVVWVQVDCSPMANKQTNKQISN